MQKIHNQITCWKMSLNFWYHNMKIIFFSACSESVSNGKKNRYHSVKWFWLLKDGVSDHVSIFWRKICEQNFYWKIELMIRVVGVEEKMDEREKSIKSIGICWYVF